jgi:hypothetical protein
MKLKTYQPKAASIAFRCAVQAVAVEFELTEAAILGRRRPEFLAAARACLYWLAVEKLGISQLRTGLEMGLLNPADRRDHGAVANGVEQWRQRMQVDPQLRRSGEAAWRRLEQAKEQLPVARHAGLLSVLRVADRRSAAFVKSTAESLEELVGPRCLEFDAHCPVCRGWMGLGLLEQALLGQPAPVEATAA